MRKGSWKLIDAPRVELFDLGADPGEMRNVASEHPDVVAELREALRTRAERGGTLETIAGTPDDATRARLEALGYVGSGGAGETPPGSSGGESRGAPAGADPKDRVHLFNKYQEVATFIADRRDADAERVIREILGEDPGNAWGSEVSTKDAHLVRKCGVAAGDAAPEDEFSPEVEWTDAPFGDLSDLGVRDCPALGAGGASGEI